MSGYKGPRLLTAADDLGKFDCGEPSLNGFLRERALTNNASGASRTFVATMDDQVVGYYALSTGSVERAEAPKRMQRNQPPAVPVILLGRLAVDENHKGLGLGSSLLRDAILRVVRTAEDVGVRAMLVHALHEEARNFYLHFDFEPSPTDELHLFLLMNDARSLVATYEGDSSR